MEKAAKPFEFKECVIVPKSTGKKARNLRELRSVSERNGRRTLPVGEVLAQFPVALLGGVD